MPSTDTAPPALPRPVRAVAALAVALCAAFAASMVPGVRPHAGPIAVWDTWVYDAISFCATAACAGRAITVARERAAWLLLGGALLAACAGDFTWSLLEDPGVPSLADLGWVGFYPLAYAGLVALTRARGAGARASLWLDGLVPGLACASVVAALAWDTIAEGAAGGPLAVATALAYPIGDLVLLVLVMGSFGLHGWRPGAGGLALGVGLVVWGAADTIYLYETARGTYAEGAPLDLLWPLGMVLLALAAVAPPPGARRRPRGRARSTFPTIAALAAGGLLLALPQGGGDDLGSALAAGAALAAIGCAVLSMRDSRVLADTRRLADTDELTGLANRRALGGRLEEAMGEGAPIGLVLFDLDGFKEVNDTLGHPAGDDLLRRVAARLAGVLRPEDLLARLGGDEFAVAIAGADDERATRAVVERLQSALEAPFELDGLPTQVDASFGVALYPRDGADAIELLKHADVAMYHAKREHTGVELYRPRGENRRDRLVLAGELRAAVESGELELFVQPIVSPATGRLAAAEALVRWRHPARGLLAPGAFLPAVERSPVMRALTDRLIAEALALQARWAHEGLPGVPLAVNLAPANLLDRELPARVEELLATGPEGAGPLWLEVTETAVMVDAERTLPVLEALRELGVRLALDDFGTGQSSLAMLKRLPVHQVKVDRGFAQGMVQDERDQAIVAAVLAVGSTFGLEVVVEGVETAEACDALARAGCDLVQGFHIARPMPGRELPSWALGARLSPSGRANA